MKKIQVLAVGTSTLAQLKLKNTDNIEFHILIFSNIINIDELQSKLSKLYRNFDYGLIHSGNYLYPSKKNKLAPFLLTNSTDHIEKLIKCMDVFCCKILITQSHPRCLQMSDNLLPEFCFSFDTYHRFELLRRHFVKKPSQESSEQFNQPKIVFVRFGDLVFDKKKSNSFSRYLHAMIFSRTYLSGDAVHLTSQGSNLVKNLLLRFVINNYQGSDKQQMLQW